MICCIVGARPNFIKMSPVVRALEARGIAQTLIHTGQHYDAPMSDIFFQELHLPRPALDLGVGSGSHAQQMARIMAALEPALEQIKPTRVIVAGDVNSTLAAALVVAKMQIPIAHVEAGLRSFDRTMPEEINRILTDHLADLLFTTEASGDRNLLREGIAREQIFFVGNCMIDTLDKYLGVACAREPWNKFQLEPQAYGVVTLHRPSNVDIPAEFRPIARALVRVSQELPLIFPVHPRTRPHLQSVLPEQHHILVTEPLGYLDFLGLMANARLVLTDSGGVQEETTALGVPCLTVRDNTERPVTIELGTNQLVGRGEERIGQVAFEVLELPRAPRPRPPLWDGHAGERIAQIIQDCEKK
ncbi:MAG TPA: UDP-N-acetylglucosamine 2-epimerase (non-hydrolyzing) [Anaerolineae bacterium]|nr:UDP-N-acetylglucosamine 2-epimerase (non-hydrolyzing) [Anaerolineae bacterium]